MSDTAGLWLTQTSDRLKPFMSTGKSSSGYFCEVGFRYSLLRTFKGWKPITYKANIKLGHKQLVVWND